MSEASVKEFHVGDFIFTAGFDSGNLGGVALVEEEEDEDEGAARSLSPTLRPSTSTLQSRAAGAELPDVRFKLWTRPDCRGTEFENGNRTWFFFGLRGGSPGCVVRFTVMNMNKQSKLFSQGMAPVFLAPGKTQWERIRDPPTFRTVDSNFIMSFKFRMLDNAEHPTYFAFTYPYTYRELQASLDRLSRRYGNGHRAYEQLSSLPASGIYFHRENAARSLENRRLDLLTITGLNGITDQRELSLSNIFPDGTANVRPWRFSGKKTVFLSARVHPGETCSSFVMNGFIRFLLRESDPRATVLRRKYVFKLIPMLNPDGVFNGHYRTDTRGVNLNRVYGNPSMTLHPTIYAARKLILYAHLGKDVETPLEPPTPPTFPDPPIQPPKTKAEGRPPSVTTVPAVHSSCNNSAPLFNPSLFFGGQTPLDKDPFRSQSLWEMPSLVRPSRPSASSRSSNASSRGSSISGFPSLGIASLSPMKQHEYNSQWYEMTENSRCSEGDESIADFSIPAEPVVTASSVGIRNGQLHTDEADNYDFLPPNAVGALSAAMRPSVQQQQRTSFLGAFRRAPSAERTFPAATSRLSDTLFQPSNLREEEGEVGAEDGVEAAVAGSSGVVGLDEDITSASDMMVQQSKAAAAADLGPTFPAENGQSGLFMYIDIHGHASKRGIFMYGNHFANPETKVSSLLFPKLMSMNCANFDFPACNFTERNMFMKDRHTGAGREGSGRVSMYRATGVTYCYTLECNFNTGRITNSIPMASRDLGRASPPPAYDSPPKYGPPIYEDAGKSLAVSVLDITESNPWTRLTCSSCKNLKGVRAWVRNYIKTSEAEAAVAKANKSAKASPMRTRLRSLSGVKKSSVVKQLKLPKSSPSSPDAGRPPPSKIPRKINPTKNAQSASAGSKLMRQLSSASLKSFAVETSSAKRLNRPPRLGSGKVKKLKRPGSKGSSRGSSKPSSRASSPRRTKGNSIESGSAGSSKPAIIAKKKGGGGKSRANIEPGSALLPSLDTPLTTVKKKKKKRMPLTK